jgi:hypothetical protein
LKDYKKRVSGRSADLKEAILEYFEKYPESKDTILGIAQWWVSESPEKVEAVLEELVEKGLIEKRNFSSLVLYSLNSSSRKDKIKSSPWAAIKTKKEKPR